MLTDPVRAANPPATVCLAVASGGVIQQAEWQLAAHPAAQLAGKSLATIVRPADRVELARLCLSASSTGSRARGYVHADLGAGPSPASLTVDDRLADLGVLVVGIHLLAAPTRLAEQLRQALLNDRHLAVLSVGLQHLQQVDDALGHRKGDALCLAVWHRLRAACRPGETPTELARGEYAVLCPGVHDAAVAHHVAEGLLTELNSRTVGDGAWQDVQVSVGWALAQRGDLLDSGVQLLQRAEANRYAARRFGPLAAPRSAPHPSRYVRPTVTNRSNTGADVPAGGTSRVSSSAWLSAAQC